MNKAYMVVLISILIIPTAFASDTEGEDTDRILLEGILGLLSNGQATFGSVEISLGESATRLLCRCIEDDSCNDFVSFLCDPIGTLLPSADRAFFTPLTGALSDPSAAICAAGHYGFGIETPSGFDWWERPDMYPADPVLSIEAARWDDGGDRNRYAIRYQLTVGSDFDDHENIRFEVRGGSPTQQVTTLAGIPQPGSAADLPLAVSFSSDTLFTRACIRFGTAPEGLPHEYCTSIVEVSP